MTIACVEIEIGGLRLPVYSLNTVVVGSGAAGLNCVNRLFREMEETGVKQPLERVALLTRGLGLGTSNHSGSDKQTYYKLGTAGDDKAEDFAETLTAGGCTHADVAQVEGANSLRGFLRLADLGVPFPHDGKGGFVGYKTDHDPKQRGTSAGPWTSRFMVRKLLRETRRYGIEIFDHYSLLAIVTGGGEARGLLCVNLKEQAADNHGLALFNCRNVVAAGGGPGALYEISVYPENQMGPYAALFECGARAHNLTESQFGLASLKPRWNLSGTYQQAIPRYFSTDQDGADERDFLNRWFPSMATMATDVFLKGYQWPFDHDKVANHGSSLVDILVQNEMINNGRRVFMDFRENPRAVDGLGEFKLEELGPEALEYLKKSEALQATPIERLARMNQPSIDLYGSRGVDLWKEPLEVGVCSQHCNGGFAVDAWWESTLPHLFVIGELAGTHGVKRPGGSALNAGQVGGQRAAQRIAHIYYDAEMTAEGFAGLAAPAVGRFAREIERIAAGGEVALDCQAEKQVIQHRMSEFAGMVRSRAGVARALEEAEEQWRRIGECGLKQEREGFVEALDVRELALAQRGYLEAVRALLERGSGSRGSHLVTDPAGELPHPDLGDEWRFIPENVALREEILGVSYNLEADRFEASVAQPNAKPVEEEAWFENVWAEYRAASLFKKDEAEEALPYKIYQ